ncbi:MAG: hypothetical protein JST39_11785, partial [Bacteroidetes bacterium]|nr:hypothetical protein [Bacteroidota bacterium]
MITIEELIENYERNSDEELLHIYHQSDGYTEDARQALQTVIDKRGGIGKLRDDAANKHVLAMEEQRIRGIVQALYKTGQVSPAVIHEKLVSSVFSPNQVSVIINNTIENIQTEKADRTVKPRTIFGSLLGGFLGGTVGGGLWGLQLIQLPEHRFFLIIGIGVLMLNYALIKAFTRQS